MVKDIFAWWLLHRTIGALAGARDHFCSVDWRTQMVTLIFMMAKHLNR